MTQIQNIISDLKLSDKSPKYYQYYPQLFSAYFTEVLSKNVNELSDAGYLYYQSTLMLDRMIDDKNFSDVPMILSFQEETVKILTSIYGKDSEFWDYWNKRKKEYFDAVVIEKNMNFENAQWETYEDLADKKSAFGKIAIDSLFALSEKKYQLYESLLKSHAFFSVGFQLYDDVTDFKQDLEHGQFNWAAYQLNKEVDFAKNDLQTLNKLLYIRGIAQSTLQQSIEYFDKAKKVLLPYKIESEWLQTIEKMRSTINLYLDSTEGFLKSVLKKIDLQEQNNVSPFITYEHIESEKIKKGLDYLKNSYANNYAELQHIMYLSKLADDFDNHDDVHCSDTFQRAMLNCCLLDICGKQNINCSYFINRELEYIIGRRNQDAIGGWSYFPTVKEIAADIDDLGQIMQLFILSGHKDYIESYCLPAIQTALDSKYNKNGGFSTWIIPNENRNEIQEKQVLFNETKWGTGPDVEVTANFAYALSLYQPDKYKHQIQNAVKYIVESQNEKGYWESRWYYGNIYGTYACLRLLRQYPNDLTALSTELATDYLLCTTNADGGFGLEEGQKSNMLSTAFAILALKLFYNNDNAVIQNAVKFLTNNQQKDGSWEMIKFIKPKADEPYKSKTLTTAFVLQSLL